MSEIEKKADENINNKKTDETNDVMPESNIRSAKEPDHVCQFCGSIPANETYSVWNFKLRTDNIYKLCEKCKKMTG